MRYQIALLIVVTFLASSLPIGISTVSNHYLHAATVNNTQNVHERAKNQQTTRTKKRASTKSTRNVPSQGKKTSKRAVKTKTALKSSSNSSRNTSSQRRKAAASKTAKTKSSSKAKRTARKHTYKAVQNTQVKHVPSLASRSVLVFDEATDRILLSKNEDKKKSIASITKLMTSMVVLDAGLPMDEEITITEYDIDTIKNSSSRLAVGTKLTRSELLRLALMSSENRAASALARTYPGGKRAFVAAMNRKAKDLEMHHTRFTDPTGLSSANISTASDLVRLVQAANTYPLIRIYSTSDVCEVPVCGRMLPYKNTNELVREGKWDINISKTGYIREAGRCLVMQARIDDRPMIIVLLDSQDKGARIKDARAIKSWIEATKPGLVSDKDVSKRAPDSRG